MARKRSMPDAMVRWFDEVSIETAKAMHEVLGGIIARREPAKRDPMRREKTEKPKAARSDAPTAVTSA